MLGQQAVVDIPVSSSGEEDNVNDEQSNPEADSSQLPKTGEGASDSGSD